MSDVKLVRYHFESAGLPSADIQVRMLRVVEALNEPYRLELTFDIDDPDVDIAEMLGRDCVLEITRGDWSRRVCAFVRHLEEGEDQASYTGRLVAVPALWTLGLRRDTRIFQEMTVPDILSAVFDEALGPYGREVRKELDATYPRREYCVQYQETDLDFAHRLMEEEGISYGFDHEGDKEVLVLRDANKSFPELDSGVTVPYQPHNFEIADAQPINRFHRRQRTMTTSAVVGDWNWTKGKMPFSLEQRSQDPLGRDRESYEHGEGRSLAIWDYDVGARAYQADDRVAQAKIRQELHVRDTIYCEGISRVIGVIPGCVLELDGHPNIGFDARYLVLRVEHVSAQLEDAMDGAGAGDPYVNRFECIPLETTYRPERRAPKPHVPGIQTAVVTGPAGEEIHTDEHGRIKVQFHWDRVGTSNQKSSCWIRVQQAWAGAGWGFWYLPRVGMEVVVHFVDGDPDRPLVTGCVYNGTNLLPYPLPAEKTKSTIKSNSSPGGGGSNEFRFEDKKGSEEIYTHAQKDYNEVVENDHNTLVHHDQTNTVDKNQTQVVGNDQTETVNGNQTMTVDGNRTVHVQSNYDETVDGTETRHVVGNVTETFSANETRTISANVTESITGNETRTIAGSQTESITGNEDLSITGSSTHTVTGSLSQTVTGGITVTTPAAYSITAVGGLNIMAPAGVTLTVPGGLQIAAPGGVVKVDSVFKWEGVKKLEVCGFASGYTYVKDSFTGIKYEATGVKIEGNGIKIANEATEIEAEGAAIFAYANTLLAGAIQIAQGMGIWI